ncbi:MAG: peptidoglycan-associated lipoprotein [Ferrovum sp. 37-45-19]|uniref:peptidoglycan-associated lipoprotein Pal n=1 Tax=Ferrovum sp. JA12 TaxID=1356299 RepID=UPI0007026506|nr:peptidoglycan-associated lipoprotein Pal [Ferrovum sp. JA12]OYV80114.1 MAG: peptidoglycan-associated lipoprotein [Ferrovum sp. 21-44-67]OYV93325.1 MAG: peptidoglycan-associated lipoprotein [Ferrovum sp. 37-45-19]OZB33538.1 MAG: peptidoglycan-associated lipoprotein [Ferrovum sp. 34-44-207]HQT82354.1 peptidoglycan-associated lipoprotein Pal [Ferrovaceae bacterium]KRH77991.1 peptidoglycan-associated lipoprotein precursor [Ferrovum sp. JA12]
MKKLMLALIMTGALAACSSTPTPAPTADTGTKTEAPAAAAPMANEMFPAKGVGGALGQRSVYYDFDKFAVKDQYAPIVTAHAGFLSSHKAAHVTLQGNCDERGSREYNLALGQRRADSVKKLMMAKGVNADQIDTISFGKEKPHNPGHNKAAWAENRRTDIVYRGE